LRKILIFGNSSSGKSSLAKKLSKSSNLAHLDLDTIAWCKKEITNRASSEHSRQKILDFVTSNKSWVIEGCYTDLLEIAKKHSKEIIFLNLEIQQCIKNANKRPWEPHKYKNKEAQDKNLDMLVTWIKGYASRDDIFSYKQHIKFYESYEGKKMMLTKNEAT